ncbi:hypothetical protein AB0N87_36155 [Streptomyces sp. NPDC093228]|jgi:hypothetical protein|uniref:hypothetical protein n=1 Tax=unclassified Streptomyces TaxID=2593676 RepID=UPI00074139A8|nr:MULTISPECIES: hypothetical protein [unclassified Streptomyces]KUJ37783.1 hypothetical protein ADL25_27275 [Streptomyces sp. NRRL F-5122]MDX3265170.1 hypothetical protein [Streptomyces sp. MI02-2A]
MDPIALAAGTALVSAIAADAWQGARTGMVALWRRVRPEQAEAVDAELAETRAQVLAARQTGEADTEQALVADWQMRIQALLRSNPAVADELRQLLDTQLTSALSEQEQSRIGTLLMRAEASGSGRVYQAGRDQHITER